MIDKICILILMAHHCNFEYIQLVTFSSTYLGRRIIKKIHWSLPRNNCSVGASNTPVCCLRCANKQPTLHWTLDTAHCTFDNAQLTLNYTHYILYKTRLTLHTFHCILIYYHYTSLQFTLLPYLLKVPVLYKCFSDNFTLNSK